MSIARSLWQSVRREAGVALRTFAIAWLVLTVALSVYCAIDSPRLHGVGDRLIVLSLGTVVCAFYTFWPAFAVAACRAVYRVLGWGAYFGAALGAAGILTSLVLFRHVLGDLVVEVFAAAGGAGPCGAHAGGAAAIVVVLLCIILAVVGSAASWWALLKLFLVFSLAVVLGALPAVALWSLLIARKIIRFVRKHRRENRPFRSV